LTHSHQALNETEARDRLLPLVEGRVFHVTLAANVPAITAAGAIEPNIDGAFATTFGCSSNSYFRNRGCVSLFDLRAPRPDEMYLHKCWPFRPGKHAILSVSPTAYTALLPWTLWRDEEAFREKVVPYVEAGYKGPLSLTLIDELIDVEVQGNPDLLVAKLLEGHRRAARRS
jgi:hypothetical protein